MKLPKERVPYSAIVDRPPLKLPNGARMAVWVIVNIEEWSIERAMPRTVLPPPMGQPLLPDLPNWSWHEYGNRVGFWRLRDALVARCVPATFALNGIVVESYPRIAEAALDAGWEFMGHGYLQGPMHKLDDQPAAIMQALDTIEKFAGSRPRGWESPGLTETYDTIDYLAEAGIEYVADWVLDDQPVEIATKHGPVVSIPYTVETNDITIMALQNHSSDEFLRRGRDQFDRLYAESADITRVMAISLHAYITGAAHRIRYLEELLDYVMGHDGVMMWSAGRINDWYREQIAGQAT
jgi:peptidoglycan/xylan/chitin deacetylase (PgdA/CDA1 family)